MNQMDSAVHDAISAHFGPGEVVTRWVLLVETFDIKGRRVLWPYASDGLDATEAAGLFGIGEELTS